MCLQISIKGGKESEVKRGRGGGEGDVGGEHGELLVPVRVTCSRAGLGLPVPEQHRRILGIRVLLWCNPR